VANFIQEQGKDDRHRKAKHKPVQADQQGITEQLVKLVRAEKHFEVVKADPGACPHATKNLQVLERHLQPVKRQVGEDREVNNGREYQQVQLPAFPHATPQRILPPGTADLLQGERVLHR
jgi:hypothetical protein